jgi:hypothetical protein
MATFVVNKNNTYSYAAKGKVAGKDVAFGHKGEIAALTTLRHLLCHQIHYICSTWSIKLCDVFSA